MALSMTGCGEALAADASGTCRVELRCVNNRFLKLSIRTRDGFGLLESQIEAVVRQRVRRGAVQMSLDVTGPAALATRQLDASQLDAYLHQLTDFCSRHDLPPPRAVDALLSLPGILADSIPSREAIDRTWPLVAQALSVALDGLDSMRRAEGMAMARDMLVTCGEITSLAATIRARVPVVVDEYRIRLHERVGKLLQERGAALSENDLVREIALIADRSDIAEELVRLESHLQQFERLLAEESPGRSLDFLTQELAREANTIGSKSLDVTIAHTVVEIKTRIERLRELVQNIE